MFDEPSSFYLINPNIHYLIVEESVLNRSLVMLIIITLKVNLTLLSLAC